MSITHEELKTAQRIARDLRITQEREDEINPHPEELHRTAEKAARLIEEWALRLEWQQRDLERMRLLTRKQGESPWANACIHDAEELLQKTQQLENENAALRVELQEQCALNGTGSEREYVLRGRVDRLKRENAALRKDKERLDWLEECHGWPEYIDAEWHFGGEVFSSHRAAIDAARAKEAKP